MSENAYPDTVKTLDQPEPGSTGRARIAYRDIPRNASSPRAESDETPGILFCGGFHSNMDGGKAAFLSDRCAAVGLGFVRFDYRGHGLSGGAFADGTIGDWYDDARLVFDTVCDGPQIVVGSSMGGWMALLLARDRPERIKGLVLIAPAPDFPRRLMLPQLDAAARQALDRDGVWHRPSEFEDDPYPITRALIEESAQHEVLGGPRIAVNGPVHILHGTNDEVVPLAHAHRVAEQVTADRVDLEVVEGGGHRLSDPPDLERLWRALQSVSG